MSATQLGFRIDWGYQYLYSRRHYHPVYHWDGHLECSGGTVEKVWQLSYPVIWYGPGHCAHKTPLDAPAWKSSTKRGIAGVEVQASVSENTVFHLVTLSGNFDFSAEQILKQGHLEFPVGPKYLGCHVIVTRNGYYWTQGHPQADRIWEADDLAESAPVRDWARMRTAWVAPGSKIAFSANVDVHKADFAEEILHLVAMAAPEYTPEKEGQTHDFFPLRLLMDGKECVRTTRYFREHDTFMQLLEDTWFRFQASPGTHRFELCNDNPHFFLLVNRLVLQHAEHCHLELSLPQWALAGERLIGRVFSVKEEHTRIDWVDGSCELTLKKGWNEFPFTITRPGVNVPVKTPVTQGVIPVVYALKDETPEVMVGYDMTTVPHDDGGIMDWLLDYTERTRLGNLVVFRNFIKQSVASYKCAQVPDALLTRWGKFCLDHRIYVEAATDFDSGALVKAAGPMLHSVGRHEWPGAVYAFDPQPEWESPDMKTAMEHCLTRLKIEIDRARKTGARTAFGDASGGHRYCYMAGVDFIRSETMVPHTQHLCSQARPAAEVFRNGEWGVHIAIQHAFQPYFDTHLGQYFLSLFQPWMMGASMIYEEDSLFLLFKEERQAWDDRHTKGKRDMTRNFFRFVKTHPRKGRVTRKIAFVEGRYAAPFNGFICDVEQDPDYSVWGLFGNRAPEWGHRQPEKCRQLLDVLMPGANTHPLRQDFNRRRFFFSGTPYGDFDEIPTEADANYFARYSLLLHLGWNTMIQEDYDKLDAFVSQGGNLLIGLPEFSRHVKRDFLRDMEDLMLWNNGDLADLCGVRVQGPGEPFSGRWNCAERERYEAAIPRLSGVPSKSPDEDGPCRLAQVELCGARPLIWDSVTGNPVVVQYRKGKGTVFLITAYAYPGHEALREVVSALMVRLAEENRPQSFVEDPSREVFWNEWVEPDGIRSLMLLNTDWSCGGNRKHVTIHAGGVVFETEIVEQVPKILTILPEIVLEPASSSLHLEMSGGKLIAHGCGKHVICVHRPDGAEMLSVDLTERPFAEITI